MGRVVLMRRARRQLHSLDLRFAEAVANGIGLLAHDPFASDPLRGTMRGVRVMRIGWYRILYELRDGDQTVRVLAIRHRAHAYRTDPRG